MRNKLQFVTMLFLCLIVSGQIAEAEPPTGVNLGHDYTFQLVTGDLTSTYQYSTVVTTGTAATESVLLTKDLDLVFGSAPNRSASKKYLIACYFHIIGEFKAASTGTADVEWKPQARNADGTWVDLADYVDMANVGTSYTQSILKGYFTLVDNFDEMPFDFQILIKCDEDDEGMGRIKSGSYVRAIFRDITWGL